MSAGLLDELLTDVRDRYEALRWPPTDPDAPRVA
jgi:hypothetical protein